MAERVNNRGQTRIVEEVSTATLLGWRGDQDKNPFQDFAHEVVAASLYVLQVSRFREDQSSRLIDFLVEYGVPKDIAINCLELGLHPGTRKLLFNHEFRAFDSAFTKERAESKSWTPGNLRVFMSQYGQEPPFQGLNLPSHPRRHCQSEQSTTCLNEHGHTISSCQSDLCRSTTRCLRHRYDCLKNLDADVRSRCSDFDHLLSSCLHCTMHMEDAKG